MPKPVLLFPFGGNAREALSVIREINRVTQEWDVLGFLDDDPALWGQRFAGASVLGSTSLLKEYGDSWLLAVPGRSQSFTRRLQIIQSLGVPLSRFATVVHPSVFVGEGTQIGNNTVIMPNCVLTAGVTVGNHVVMLPGTVVSHDASIGDGTLIGSNVSISGGVTVEPNCYIGTGAKIIEEITIGSQALVGLGAIVVRDVPEGAVVVGCPARPISKTKQ